MIVRALLLSSSLWAGCATTPIAFSVTTNAELAPIAPDPEVRSGGSSLQLHFDFANDSTSPYWLCVCAAAIHVESITRDGQPVESSLLDINHLADPRRFFAQQLHAIESQHELALQTEGLQESRVEHDQWRLVGYKLMRGRYRVVFSYQYEGPDYGHQNIYRGKLIARAVTFNVE